MADVASAGSMRMPFRLETRWISSYSSADFSRLISAAMAIRERGRHLEHIHGTLIIGSELGHALSILPRLIGKVASKVNNNIGDKLLGHGISFLFSWRDSLL